MVRKCMEVKVGGAGKRAAEKDRESKPGGATKKRASKKSAKSKVKGGENGVN